MSDPAQKEGVEQPFSPRMLAYIPSEAEQHQLLSIWNQTQSPCPDLCVHQLFDEQVEKTPDAVAVRHEAEQLSYRELQQRAHSLACYLQSQPGFGTGDKNLVGLCVERSLDLAVGVLGILQAGAAYVPFDPAYPPDRLRFMLENSGVQYLVTTETILTQFPKIAQVAVDVEKICLDSDWAQIAQAGANSQNSVPATAPETLAYVLYTSGSTGTPKGVAMPHRSLFNLIWWQRNQPHLASAARTLQFSPISFDVSFQELFSTWCTGGTLVMVSEETRRDPHALLNFLAQEQIERLFLPFVALQQLAEAAQRVAPPTSLRNVITAGEQLQITAPVANLFRRLPVCALHNHYGPTETHVVTTHTLTGRVDDWPTLPPIGLPLANVVTYIVDPEGKPVPVGVPGELLIGGNCLAAGYLGRPELTAERFVPNPFVDAAAEGEDDERQRLYKTGDLAEYLPNGDIQYLGRADNQVKIRGFRVEPGEIEVTLSQHPQVREAVVLAHDDGKGTALVAYIVPQADPTAAHNNGFHQEQIDHWEMVWDATYSQSAAEQDPTLNLLGWRDSYSGQPIPKAEMQEWADTTVDRILAWQPRQVLELGCGTGMLLFRIAPHCNRYIGTDLSQQALHLVNQHLGELSHKVELRHQPADTMDGLESETPDMVVINSVVELFPSIDYLLEVLEKAVQQVQPGGVIFVGDVRDYSSLEAFHASVQLHQAHVELDVAQLRQRIRHTLSEESQLTVDPAFFTALPQRLPQISHVQIQLRRGHHHNEMTRFRYDVLLHVGKPEQPFPNVDWCNWQADGLTIPAIRTQLAQGKPASLGIRSVPNARIATEMKLLDLLATSQAATAQTTASAINTVGALRQVLQDTPLAGVEPEAFWSLSDEMPYTVYLFPSATDAGCFDVVFLRQEDETEDSGLFANTVCNPPEAQTAWATYANQPGRSQQLRQLEPALRSHVAQHLPEYMVPQSFLMLDSLPLTPSGKIDRRALPAPSTDRPQLSTKLVNPRTELEELIASVWREALQLDTVGIHDNFFELGGHSLLLTQVHNKLLHAGSANNLIRQDLSVMKLFEHPTIHALATYLSSDEEQAQDGSPSPETSAPPQAANRQRRRASTQRLRQRRTSARSS